MRNNNKHYKQGIYTPKNPKKYRGDVNNIIFRSGWEEKVLEYLDDHPDVIEFSSEEVIIPYISPVDLKPHRYFVDFLVRVKTKDGKIKTYLLEVKPKAQTAEPKRPKRQTKKYLNEVMTWGVNQAKWESAEEYCADRGWEFLKITEDDIFGKWKIK